MSIGNQKFGIPTKKIPKPNIWYLLLFIWYVNIWCIYVLWPILTIEFDDDVRLVVWGHFSKSFQRRSVQGLRQKGQIFKFIYVNKKYVYLDQFLLRNLMVSFVFTHDHQKVQKMHVKKWRNKLAWFSKQKQPIWGLKLSYQLEIVYTGWQLVLTKLSTN